ncbi:hypothetical protein BDZ89DRAFT_1062681 [Hymenopellis radicata]|nr:hypothetical protein BDZ89DRAFT_1062681 [Hymenopellis radicata]
MTKDSNSVRCTNCALLFLRPSARGQKRTARVEELLRQNHPPHDVELSHFRKVVEDTPAALRDLDAKISQARELLDTLLSERKQTQSHFEDAKSLLHPMLAQPGGAPWLLTRVCRRWRALAVNLPQLWTYLALDFDKHIGHITPRQCAYRVGLFIERSKGLPMTVYLGSEENITDHAVIPVLEVTIPRWKYLDVDLPRTSLQCLSGNHFLKLQGLIFRYNTEDEWDVNVDVFQPTTTPVLRKLQVSVARPWRALGHVRLPWSQVTSIASFPAFDADALTRLRTLTNLEELRVEVSTSGVRNPNPDVVPLPKLRRLSVEESDNALGRSAEFLTTLRVPALSNLFLDFPNDSVTLFPTSPLSFGNLTTLSLSCEMNSHSESTGHLLNFLTLTQHVECLRFYDLGITVEFFEGLTFKDGSPLRLPCLRSLDIGRCLFAPTFPANLSPLVDMLYSRLPGDGQDVHGSGQGSGSPSLESKTSRVYLNTVRLARPVYRRLELEKPDLFSKLSMDMHPECYFDFYEL